MALISSHYPHLSFVRFLSRCLRRSFLKQRTHDIARPRLHVHIDTLSLPDAGGGGTGYADAVRSALASALAGRRQSGASGPEATARTIADAVRAQMRIRRV
jgi:hypothetical protein